jgi:hypothetical protein
MEAFVIRLYTMDESGRHWLLGTWDATAADAADARRQWLASYSLCPNVDVLAVSRARG